MNGVEYYIGGERTEDRPLRPYSPEALAFVAELSAALMQSPAARVYPDMMALAFWCRRSNLQKMQETCPEAEIRLDAGFASILRRATCPSILHSVIFLACWRGARTSSGCPAAHLRRSAWCATL